MTKVTEYKKLSKKAKRILDLKKRRTWGTLNPITRKSENPQAYKRCRVKQLSRKDEN